MGQADTTTIYYSAMQKTLHETALQHNSTWLTMSGITEGMKNTRIKYLTGQLPQPRTSADTRSERPPCAHAATNTQAVATMQWPAAQPSWAWSKRNITKW
jgi:hypothetical protein